MPVEPKHLTWHDYYQDPKQIEVGITYYQHQLLTLTKFDQLKQCGQMILNLKYLKNLIIIQQLPYQVIAVFEQIIQKPYQYLNQNNQVAKLRLQHFLKRQIKTLRPFYKRPHRRFFNWLNASVTFQTNLNFAVLKNTRNLLAQNRQTNRTLLQSTFKQLNKISHHLSTDWSNNANERIGIVIYVKLILILKYWRKLMYRILENDFRRDILIEPDAKFQKMVKQIINTR